jgi:hypothetical protein
MVREHRQPRRLDRDEQNKPRAAVRRFPQRRVALERRVWRLQIVVGDDAQHVVGCVKALFHPAVNVVAALDLPFVHMRHVAERRQLLTNPVRPIAIGGRIGDEKIRHRRRPDYEAVRSAAGFRWRLYRGHAAG